jgi:hypothetical protein
MKRAVLGAAIISIGIAAPVRAQTVERLTALQAAAACAPLPEAWLPPNPIQIVGAQGSVIRMQFGTRDLVVLNGGINRGLQLNQRFYVRRAPLDWAHHGTEVIPRGASTTGWLRIIATNDSTAIGVVEFACDSLLPGDVLQPYADPKLPANADRTDTTGDPDFAAAGRVLFGDSERLTGATGDFVVSNVGSAAGTAAGSRLAIYRRLGEGLPLMAIGEAVAIAVDQNFSVVRITRSRDAVASGDLLVPRR